MPGANVMSPTDALGPWHEFYMLGGTASATMVGLLFVAASVGAGVFSADRRAPLRVFLSASVVNFSTVLAACLVVLAPVGNWMLLGGADRGLRAVRPGPWLPGLARHRARWADRRDRSGGPDLVPGHADRRLPVRGRCRASPWHCDLDQGCTALALSIGTAAGGRHPQRLGHHRLEHHAAPDESVSHRTKTLQSPNPWPIYRLSFRDCVINGRFFSSEVPEISIRKPFVPI